jgi:hypothetical protein
VALATVAEGLVDAARLEDARRVADTIPNPQSKSQALVFIAEAGDEDALDEARRVADTIPDPWAKSQALVFVAEGLVKAARFGEARQVTDTISDAGWRARGLGAIAEAMITLGDRQSLLIVETQLVEWIMRI